MTNEEMSLIHNSAGLSTTFSDMTSNSLYLEHYGRLGMRWYKHIFTSGNRVRKMRQREEEEETQKIAGERELQEQMKRSAEAETQLATAKLKAQEAKAKEELKTVKNAGKNAKKEAKAAEKVAKKEQKALEEKQKSMEEAKQRKKTVADMTDDELSAAIKRLELENKYNDAVQKLYQYEHPADVKKKIKQALGTVLQNSIQNIGTQATTYTLGTALNKAVGFDMVNPKKGQKDT